MDATQDTPCSRTPHRYALGETLGWAIVVYVLSKYLALHMGMGAGALSGLAWWDPRESGPDWVVDGRIFAMLRDAAGLALLWVVIRRRGFTWRAYFETRPPFDFCRSRHEDGACGGIAPRWGSASIVGA